MTELFYKDMSYKLTGIAFEIYKKLGGELREKTYSNAFEEILKREHISYERELYYPVKIEDKTVGQNYFDFLINDEIIIEIKRGEKNYFQACDQLFNYLKSSKLKLGLIFRFTRDGVKTKRVPNLY